MNKPMTFLSAFILAISQMFIFAPKSLSPTGLNTPFNPSIQQSFKNVWAYVGKAVNNEQKQ